MLLADIVLTIHFLYIFFIIAGFLLIWVGGFIKWQWIKNFWFRIAHFAAIAFVALISILGVPCPLTIIERNLRIESGATVYEQSFVHYWLHKFLFFDWPERVFLVIYVSFAIVVIGTFYFIPVQTPNYLKNFKNK